MPQENSPLTTELPERFNLATDPPADGRLTALRELFPEVIREGKIDFDALHLSLGDWIDPGPERFGLTWPGKLSACVLSKSRRSEPWSRMSMNPWTGIRRRT
jgi:hypothetical protein